ncbi:hypothetical protein [uncultured Maribacter sp.]|uniref:hypothetical protein n=1 Tax=uncultured Maribacter sp. TaxID=431308 RepID=UPI00261520F2|nr:hypothetical protein [uncultured Maribacter sp.]
MRKFILITILAVSIISCKEKTKSDSNVETIKIENLTPSPIVHESLNDEQLKKIKFIQETFNEVYPVSLEETITNFKRDQNPDNEINVWLNMAKTFQPFASENSGAEKIEVRKEAFKLILMRSMMPEKDAIHSSELKILSENEIQDILKNYTLEAKPIKVEKR